MSSTLSSTPLSASSSYHAPSTYPLTTAPTPTLTPSSSPAMPATSTLSTPASTSESVSSPSPTTSPSSASSVKTTTSTDDPRPTSTSTTTTTTPTPVQSSTPTSPSSSPSTTSSAARTSTVATSASTSTSNTPSTSPLSSTSSSQSPSPAGTSDIPLTTVLESTTIFVTSTNSLGQVLTSVPPVVTEVITTTGSGGVATTVTQAVVNPTLASNDNTLAESSFFKDTGAVVGVFVVVGLATASIMLWIFFAIHRRQRMRRLEQDTVIEAAVAAAGFNRAPLDDDDEAATPMSHSTSGIIQRTAPLSLGRSGSVLPPTRFSHVPDDLAEHTGNSSPGPPQPRASGHPEGYMPARTTSPSPRTGGDLASSRDRKSSYGHTPTYSAGSFEPLLANYTQNTSDQEPSAAVLPRARSPHRPGNSSAPNGYSSEESRRNSSDSSVLPDEDVYGHYVLMVRNVPDDDDDQHSPQ